MQRDPLPVVICSGLARRGTELAMRALAHGAVDIVERPRFGVRGFLEDVGAAPRRAPRRCAARRGRGTLPRAGGGAVERRQGSRRRAPSSRSARRPAAPRRCA